jgi:hypothetical protein
MAQMIHTAYEESTKAGKNEPQAWHCFSCQRIHLRTGEHLLTFTSEEFAVFTQSVVECYCRQVVFRSDDDSPDHEVSVQVIDETIN